MVAGDQLLQTTVKWNVGVDQLHYFWEALKFLDRSRPANSMRSTESGLPPVFKFLCLQEKPLVKYWFSLAWKIEVWFEIFSPRKAFPLQTKMVSSLHADSNTVIIMFISFCPVRCYQICRQRQTKIGAPAISALLRTYLINPPHRLNIFGGHQLFSFGKIVFISSNNDITVSSAQNLHTIRKWSTYETHIIFFLYHRRSSIFRHSFTLYATVILVKS